MLYFCRSLDIERKTVTLISPSFVDDQADFDRVCWMLWSNAPVIFCFSVASDIQLGDSDWSLNSFSVRPFPPLSLLSPAMSKEEDHIKLSDTSPIQAAEEGGDMINEKKLLRKIDRHLIPGLTVLFLLSFLDRSNGNSSLSLPCLSLNSPPFSRKCSYRGSCRRHTYECVSFRRT